MADGTISVTHVAPRERYLAELTEDGADPVEVGYVDYTQGGDHRALTHTVIYDRFGGRGFAGEVVRQVLDDVRDSGLQVVPVCSYVQSYLEKHPEYSDLVAS
ncbi:GNAT family N-acetyltransferase [Gordonia zhaorongruii]|uniref:GNAT family N-acetyltransferase n=1 Tax=Gordonia zhaorongruii TaxID=2597659 RepID=UPI00104D8357|nr:GNAT family N-acetyltransferase [Gordonia zhaorongruii]